MKPSKHARSGHCWPSVGRAGKSSANLPTLFQCCQCFVNIFAKAVVIVVVSFLEFFHNFLMIQGHFLLFIGIQFAKKIFYFDSANVGGILDQHRLPTSALCISTNTGPTLDASPKPTLLDKSFINYRQFFIINLGCSSQKCWTGIKIINKAYSLFFRKSMFIFVIS